MPKSPTRLAAEKLCAKFPDAPSLTLAKRLAKSHQTTVENARSFVRKIRGNMGDGSRKGATQSRENQPAGWKPEMPPSLAEPWLPFDLGNDIRVAIMSDLHVPYHSDIALKAAVKHLKRRKPNVLLINGDYADFYKISRHQQDPSKRKFSYEMQLVREGLAWLRKEFGKDCRIVLKAGNHEERWQHFLWNHAPEICDEPRMRLAEWIDAAQFGIEVVTDQRPVVMGKLPALHGHEFGRGGIASPVNPARGLFLRSISTMIIGHGHRTSHHVQTDWLHKQISCWTMGCLCELNPEWLRINTWNHGAAFNEVDSSGEHHVDNFRIGPAGEIW